MTYSRPCPERILIHAQGLGKSQRTASALRSKFHPSNVPGKIKTDLIKAEAVFGTFPLGVFYVTPPPPLKAC